MKRCIAFVLSLIFILSFTACGTKDQPAVKEPESRPSSASEPAVEPAPESSAAPESASSDEESEPGSADAPAVTSPEEDTPNSSSAGTESDPEEKPLNFRLGPDGEVKALRAGDTLGDWTLGSYRAVWDEESDGLPRVYEANFIAPEDAPMELSCTVCLNPMASEERIYWFDVAEEDYDKMPVMEGTDARPRFMSTATAALSALETLGANDRLDCRVAVSRYEYSHLAMAAYDIADIVWLELQ